MVRVVENALLRHPLTGDLVPLMAGSEVPEWAVGLVGSHLLAGDSPTPAVEAVPVSDAVPDESWTVADLRDYAKAHDVDLHGASSKADILDAITG